MKVICINKSKGIDDSGNESMHSRTMGLNSFYDKKLTIGKIYEILTYSEYGDTAEYFIADDGSELLYFANDKDFITLEQWREQQLNKIGIL